MPGASTSSSLRWRTRWAASSSACRPRRCCRRAAAVPLGAYRRAPRSVQEGLSYVGVVLPVGRMTTVARMRGLADVADRFGSGTLRLTVWQNLLISDIPDGRMAEAVAAIADLGLGYHGGAAAHRAGGVHRQCRLQVRRFQHKGPCERAGRVARTARRGGRRRSTSTSPAAITRARSTTSPTSDCWAPRWTAATTWWRATTSMSAAAPGRQPGDRPADPSRRSRCRRVAAPMVLEPAADRLDGGTRRGPGVPGVVRRQERRRRCRQMHGRSRRMNARSEPGVRRHPADPRERTVQRPRSAPG